jgi:undecaprenyl-diphosphatase
MHSLNSYLFTLIHQGAGAYPLLDRFFIVLTSKITFGVVFIVLIYIIAVYPLLTKDPLKRFHRIGAALEMAVSFFNTWVLVSILKVLIAHPRPFISIDNIKPLVEAAPYESFPSAHAALTMATAIAILPYRKHLGHLLITFSLVVALSRLFVGVHYPFDVGVGLLIGYLIPKFVHRTFRARRSNTLDLKDNKA